MSVCNLVRGWCPSLFQPMDSGDGLLVRIRPLRARIGASLACAIAAAADAYGNGVIEVTNRANLQLRGLRPETIAPFTAAMEAAGAAAGEGSRVLLSPLAGADPSLPPDLADIAAAIDAALPPGLPPKWAVLLDGGGALPMAGLALDATIRRAGAAWSVAGEIVESRALPAHIRRIAPYLPRRSDRAGTVPPPGWREGFLLVAPPFGQMRGPALAGLAGIAARLGDGALRPTPWKSLVLAGLGADAVAARAEAASLGFITHATDGRLSIRTCPGAPACLRAEAETVPAAASLAQGRRGDDPLLHVSGCAKGCAHPGAAAITLVGQGGRFDLVRQGKAADTPALRDLTLAACQALLQSDP